MNTEQALLAVEQKLMDAVETDVQVLREASQHILSAGGKRIRPRLTFLSYMAVGGQRVEEVVPVAAAVELVHTATLVHDDINDHGMMRRGRKTINSIWGRTFALLTGDYLFTRVYTLMAPYKNLNAIFAEMTVALVEGETMQAVAAQNGQLNREVYAQIIARKTASLFAGSAKMGAMLGGGTPEQIAALEQFGFNVGLAFQITDDILDLVADSKTLGKTAGIDLVQGKGFAVANAPNGGRSSGAATATIEAEDDPGKALKRKLLAGNYIQEGQQNARQLAALARMSLSALPPSPSREELERLAVESVERDH